MPEDAGPGPAPATALPSDPDDIAALLPFHLLRSQILPPAPNRRKSASDWLPEFGGAAWVAYGASSLLVISHFPNPLYEHETLVGSFLQQVIEPPPPPDAGDEPGDVNAVRWCPARPSEGEIAAAAGNCVWFYSPDAAEDDPSSFRWRQTAGIVQSFAVEAIEWTGSGDGLVAAGISVVLWVRKNMTWEMAWKSSSDIPQTMVSTTLFTEGPLATVACSSNCMSDAAVFGKKSSPLLSKECSYVSVYHRDGKSGFTKFQLFHPQPVSMIQKDTSCSWRNVLLSCCLDGTVRLWSEIENSRIKKASKDAHGKKSYKRAYHVIAVIEINQHLRGTIDMDIFISWATECGDIICEVEGGNYCLAPEVSEHGHIGKCEWVISVGPRSSLALWAIHCLDDTSPLRFPRVTLWKTLDLMEFKECKNFKSDLLHLKDQPVFVKAVASRSHPYAPPNHCSLLQLLADNSFSWLQFYSPMSNSKADGSSCQTSMEKCLPCFAGGVLNQDSHTGKIIQLDWFTLFWSLPTVSSYTLGSQAVIHPAWKLMGKVILQDKSSVTKYSAVRWAPVVLGENRFLLLGHADGIDCFVIQVSEKGETIFCHKILSIPFDGVGHEGPPDHIFATAMASTYGCSIFSNGFLLFGIWMGKFQALSWKFLPWEIVGMFNAHQGPVSAVSLSTCGGKIATIGMDGQSNSASLHIWEPKGLIGGGSFFCMPNTLCIYSEKRFTNKDLKSKKSKEMNIWFCITQSHVHYVCQDFCWGPKLSPVLVHEKHISLFSQWSSIAENMLHEGCSPTFVHGTSNDLPCALYTERDLCNAKESSLDESKHKNNQNGQNLKFVGKPYDFVISGLHSILDISDRLHGCLEVYHPQALMHYLYSGNWKHALAILRNLVESIKSDDAFASILRTETVSSSLSNKKLQWGQDICPTMLSFESPRNLLQFGGIDLLTNAPKSISTPIPEKSEITWLINTLEKTHTIPGITDNEKTQILSIVDILGEVSGTSGGSVYQSLDEPGRRFWVGVRYQHLYFLRKYGRSAAAEELVVDSAVASWAFLSDCKENLFDSIFSVESSWLEMRNMGVGYWFINTTQLRTKMEKLARSQYLKRKDPKDCALLYLALNRVQVLAGLFKISRDEKDKLLVAFLSRNFQEEKNKAAALKNAYVLMGRHQLELAIAFFLLGGDPSSAVTVCAKNLGDEQLALVICRLIEGFGGPLEHQLISSFLLPSAMEKGDYWLSSMLEWTLGNYSRSLNNLIDSQMGSINQ
ncbi:hypothetical protein J5N97_000926 [Dioscorea zingiberensis]|uniref:RAVE complex protein Rav1 C-terminal domain-containing protein n=1 Tax=Dioscorea zingiberensis TaxID=325984 RepID=A0A9D5H2U4_9LILI|nr:hypothetical protein J5N97_000926 [Dioscorea zingiberensis]